MWSVALGSKALGNIFRTPFELSELGPPRVAVPDLDVVVDAGDDDVPLQGPVLEQRRRDDDAALLVQLPGRRARVEEAVQRPRLAR